MTYESGVIVRLTTSLLLPILIKKMPICIIHAILINSTEIWFPNLSCLYYFISFKEFLL
uniref:Uncharacterized protein n=1 Tax=Nelumbo nucifera TaxID=4432 RepID=A0A822XEK8_NELNU|nr:TPA_asm: hypothetical protein HUJ06_019546 [Nelumbo nucifera]